jgi:hypothetical protein
MFTFLGIIHFLYQYNSISRGRKITLRCSTSSLNTASAYTAYTWHRYILFPCMIHTKPSLIRTLFSSMRKNTTKIGWNKSDSILLGHGLIRNQIRFFQTIQTIIHGKNGYLSTFTSDQYQYCCSWSVIDYWERAKIDKLI